jgi:DNA polymerase V
MQNQPSYIDDQKAIKNVDGVSVHGGFPNPAADTRLRSLDLNQLLISHSISTFLMHIEGNDWQDAGIYSGDIAIVDKALRPKSNDLVTWWHNDTFAISHYHTVPKAAHVWGVVTSVVHQYRSAL